MYKKQELQTNPDEFNRCAERRQKTDYRKNLSPTQKSDASLFESINEALWKDDVLRMQDYYEIEVHVKSRVVYLTGHIVSTSSQNRVKNAILTIPGILEIKNNLVLDDKLTSEIAASLGSLENTFDCKFFTGVSHGVVLLNGQVSHTDPRMRAEQCAASHPKVRGVINYIRVLGADLGIQDHRFLQPSIGKPIYFRDSISRLVRKVVINPNNRRVVAVIIQGHLNEIAGEHTSLNIIGRQSVEQLLVIPISAVKHMTDNSGFLTIHSTDIKEYQEFNESLFTVPNKDWVPPFPYCPYDVLFPVDYLQDQASYILKMDEQRLFEELLYNDSLGG